MTEDPPVQYRVQTTPQTLAGALAEYYALNRDIVVRPADMPAESAELFRSHDICHVIFGLTTSLADEGLVDARTVIGTDVGLKRYLNYLRADAEAKKLFEALGWWRALGVTLAIAPRIARSAVERLRMPRPWPWRPPETFMDRSLADLRREFGIRVF